MSYCQSCANLEAERDRLKAELETSYQGHEGYLLVAEKWKSKAEKLAAALRSHDDLSPINRQLLAELEKENNPQRTEFVKGELEERE